MFFVRKVNVRVFWGWGETKGNIVPHEEPQTKFIPKQSLSGPPRNVSGVGSTQGGLHRVYVGLCRGLRREGPRGSLDETSTPFSEVYRPTGSQTTQTELPKPLLASSKPEQGGNQGQLQGRGTQVAGSLGTQ